MPRLPLMTLPLPLPLLSRGASLVLLALLVAGPAFAQIAPEQQAPIFARVLAYDRNLIERSGGDVVVAVVTHPTDASSATDGKKMLAAFKELEKLTIKGKPFRAVAVAYTGAGALADAKTRLGVDALYLCSGLGGELGAIAAEARLQKLSTMAGNEAYASGVSMWLAVEDGKPRLTVNAAASREEGALLSSELLRIAKVIK